MCTQIGLKSTYRFLSPGEVAIHVGRAKDDVRHCSGLTTLQQLLLENKNKLFVCSVERCGNQATFLITITKLPRYTSGTSCNIKTHRYLLQVHNANVIEMMLFSFLFLLKVRVRLSKLAPLGASIE